MANPKERPVTEVKEGKLRGVYEEKGNIAVFKGIPYAKPAIGGLRWRPPEPVESWEGVREAKEHGPMAWQAASMIKEFFNGLIDGQGWGFIRAAFVKFLFNLRDIIMRGGLLSRMWREPPE